MLVTRTDVNPSREPTLYLSCDVCGASFDDLAALAVPAASCWLMALHAGWEREELGGIAWHRCPACARR